MSINIHTRVHMYIKASYKRLKAMANKWVLSRDLNSPSDGASLIRRGREFQSSGPAAAKARSPLLLRLVVRGSSSNWSADLKVLVGT